MMGNSQSGTGIALYEIHMKERELQLAESERALLELERGWRGGEQWPQISKPAQLFLNYTHSLDCTIDYPKRGCKRRRRRRRRKIPELPQLTLLPLPHLLMRQPVGVLLHSNSPH